jgi:iron-sulfur cluster assembly protein
MMEVIVTENAAKFIRRMIAFGGGAPGSGFRLAVQPGGCAGLSYDISIVEKPIAGDEIIEGPGFKVYVPPASQPFLEGVTVDFEETLMQSGLTFTNPKASGNCGCGSSFSADGEKSSGEKSCKKG